MELITLIYVLLIIAFAKAVGELVSRVNQPPIVGELLAGIILGPSILGIIFSNELGPMYDQLSEPGKFISNLADFGMLFLMLYAGLQFSPKALRAATWQGGSIAAMGVAVPLAFGSVVVLLLGLKGTELAFVSLAIAVTALPVTMRVLVDLEVMQTRTAGTIISAALVSDAALLLALGLVLSSEQGHNSPTELALLATGFVLFFALAVLTGRYAVPRIYQLLKWMQTGEAAFAVAIGFAIAFAVLAERMGLPAVIGAFIAGLLLSQTGTGLKTWERVQDILSGVTIGFLAPVFFVLIGFSVEFDKVALAVPLLISILAVAVIGKLVGSYLPARAWGYGRNESIAIGSMMMGKGAMELVFARIALEQGIIDEQMFSVLILMAFISTMLAPILFKTFYNRAVLNKEIRPTQITVIDVSRIG
jgi:Kef-type K+ transport system membrane component KefB